MAFAGLNVAGGDLLEGAGTGQYWTMFDLSICCYIMLYQCYINILVMQHVDKNTDQDFSW